MAVTTEPITFPFPGQVLKLLPAVPPETISAFQDQVLEMVRQGQDAVIKMVQTWAEATAGFTPGLPALPFTDQIPETVEVLDSTFAFLDRLLDAQKDFATAALDAAQPILGAAEKAATANNPKATTRPATKTTT